jgi:AraC family ethanolamine operon transcriptional activator
MSDSSVDASELPAVGRPVERAYIRGIADFREAVKGADFSATQTRPGLLDGELLHAFLPDLLFSAGRFTGDVRVRGAMAPPDFLSIGIILQSNGEVQQWGSDVRGGDVFSFAGGAEQDGVFAGSTAYVTIAVPVPQLQRVIGPYPGWSDPAQWETPMRFEPSHALRARSQLLLRRCMSVLRDGTIQLTPGILHALQTDLLDAFLVPAALSMERAAYEPVQVGNAAILRRFEEYVQTAGAETVSIMAACASIGCSRKAFVRAFQETFRFGPKHYLTMLRLSAANAALHDADPSTSKVAQIATQFGFWNLGRFSQVYREVFGEPPSVALRRSPDRASALQHARWLSPASIPRLRR